MTYRDALNDLTIALPFLSAKDASFANSLLSQAVAREEMGNAALSQNQWHWVRKLATKSEAPAANVGDFGAVIALFAKAGESLKFPKVRLQTESGKPVCLSVAGAKARKPGTVNVTDGAAFGANVWYGRVEMDGTFEMNRSLDVDTATSIRALLSSFAADPAKVASAYGKLVGSCCFCCRELTDQRSVRVGYGPICAGHFNLPWGE